MFGSDVFARYLLMAIQISKVSLAGGRREDALATQASTRDRRLRNGSRGCIDETLAAASMGGAWAKGNGGSDDVIPLGSVAPVSHRRRFKKPHGCDRGSRMSMDKKVGGVVSVVGLGFVLSLLVL